MTDITAKITYNPNLTLYNLALRETGSGMRWLELAKYNPNYVTSRSSGCYAQLGPGRCFEVAPGAVLVLPPDWKSSLELKQRVMAEAARREEEARKAAAAQQQPTVVAQQPTVVAQQPNVHPTQNDSITTNTGDPNKNMYIAGSILLLGAVAAYFILKDK